jgi:hypothetical protein
VLTLHRIDPLTQNPIILGQSFLAENPSRRIPSEINRDVDHSQHLLYSAPSTLNRAVAGFTTTTAGRRVSESLPRVALPAVA